MDRHRVPGDSAGGRCRLPEQPHHLLPHRADARLLGVPGPHGRRHRLFGADRGADRRAVRAPEARASGVRRCPASLCGRGGAVRLGASGDRAGAGTVDGALPPARPVRPRPDAAPATRFLPRRGAGLVGSQGNVPRPAGARRSRVPRPDPVGPALAADRDGRRAAQLPRVRAARTAAAGGRLRRGGVVVRHGTRPGLPVAGPGTGQRGPSGAADADRPGADRRPDQVGEARRLAGLHRQQPAGRRGRCRRRGRPARCAAVLRGDAWTWPAPVLPARPAAPVRAAGAAPAGGGPGDGGRLSGRTGRPPPPRPRVYVDPYRLTSSRLARRRPTPARDLLSAVFL